MDDEFPTPREKRWAPAEPLEPEPKPSGDHRPREHGPRSDEPTGQYRAPPSDGGWVSRVDLFVMFLVLCAVILLAAWVRFG